MKYLVCCEAQHCDDEWVVNTEAAAAQVIRTHAQLTDHRAYIADDCYEGSERVVSNLTSRTAIEPMRRKGNTMDLRSLSVSFEAGDEVANMRAASRDFKSGSRGFGAYGKIELDGKRYQVSCSIVEVGSKPQSALTTE